MVINRDYPLAMAQWSKNTMFTTSKYYVYILDPPCV